METKFYLENVHQLEERIAQATSVHDKVDALNNLAWRLRISQHERAWTLSKKAFKLSKTGEYAAKPYQQGLAASLTTFAFLNSEVGHLETAISECLEALSLIETHPPSPTRVDAWYTLGWAYYYLSDHPTALGFGLKALDLSRELGFKDKEAWALDAVASFDDDLNQAIQLHKNSYHIFEALGDIEGQFRVLNNWACVLFDQGNYESALEIAHKGLSLIQERDLPREEINFNETIGAILLAMGDYEPAQEYLQNAMTLSEIHGHDITYAYVLTSLGWAHLAMNDFEGAEQLLVHALETATDWSISSEKMRCHQYLSEVYEKQNKTNKALEHYKLFHALKETIAGENSAKQIAMLKMAHQVETAQHDIEIQRLQNAKLRLEINEQKRVQSILENLATRDSLTNLYNRRHFLALAEHEWKRASRYGRPFSVLMLDLDDFKQINDQYGHAMGDQALILVAGIIQAALRQVEIAGRYGGDEFAVILPNTPSENGSIVGRRIRDEITNQYLQTRTGQIKLTVSIGIAGLSNGRWDKIKSLDELLHQADRALYLSKGSGKNQVSLYTEP